MAISSYHLLRKKNEDVFRSSFKAGLIYAAVGILGVLAVGHRQAQHMVRAQPMKMAAAEALWQTENPASFSLISVVDEQERKDLWSVRIPYGLSLLVYGRTEGEVKGIRDLQEEYSKKYGSGDYVPPVAVSYWSFRLMVAAGFVMLAWVALGLLQLWKGGPLWPWYLKIGVWALALPYIANTTGWIFTEIARQPWIVFGLQLTENAVSPTVSAGMVAFTLMVFTSVYGVLMAVNVFLMKKTATQGIVPASN